MLFVNHVRKLLEAVSSGSQPSIDSIKAWLPIMSSDITCFSSSLSVIEHARSQHGQDLFALISSGFKKGGYFVEIGASNGRELSNTHILEKEFEWNGLLVEPGRKWHRSLRKNRNCRLDFRAVWRAGGQVLPFIEDSVLSTLQFTSNRDFHKRVARRRYDVVTVTPTQLLRENSVPFTIDFLSIDTEGSELEILEAFPFDKYEVKALVVEHNYTTAQQRISELLTSIGFRQVGSEFSLIDSWWVSHDNSLVSL